MAKEKLYQNSQWRIQKIWKGGGRQFISPVVIYRNAHNELYAFYTEKRNFWKKILSQ